MRVPQRSGCTSDSLINGWSINISAPSPALTIHADPKNNTPAPDFTIQKGKGGGESRRHGYPEMISNPEIIRDLLKLPGRIWHPQVAASLFSFAPVKAWKPPADSHIGVPGTPFWSTVCKCTSCTLRSLISNRSVLTDAPRRWPGGRVYLSS